MSQSRGYRSTGVGGAGNYRRVDELALSSAPSISSDVSEARSTRSSYTIGIGGAGNVVNIADNKSTAERPSFSCKFPSTP